MNHELMKMPHWPKPVGLLQNETSLQRMQEVLLRLDNPHLRLPRIIHIAGTNGKGSTLAFLQSMLEAAGKTVHKYTTPHLVDFNERITLSSRHISDDALFEIMEEVRVASEDIRLGFYEATTAGALLAFSRQPADFLLLETGLGGRLDATNIIPAPEIAIISTIDKDHVNFLGNDIRLIAAEKLHIVKRGSYCISALQQDVIYPIIENWCEDIGVEFAAFGADFGIEITQNGFNYLAENLVLPLPRPALVGNHQYINAAAAVAAALKLGLGQAEIASGLQNVKWPSRMEKIQKWGVEFWLDGAHNPAGAFVISNYVQENWADAPIYIIFGTTRGRNVAEFLQAFEGVATEIALVKIHAEPNSYEPEEMFEQCHPQSTNCHPRAGGDLKIPTFVGMTMHTSIKEAVEYFSAKPAGRILCLGSLFMRGDVV